MRAFFKDSVLFLLETQIHIAFSGMNKQFVHHLSSAESCSLAKCFFLSTKGLHSLLQTFCNTVFYSFCPNFFRITLLRILFCLVLSASPLFLVQVLPAPHRSGMVNRKIYMSSSGKSVPSVVKVSSKEPPNLVIHHPLKKLFESRWPVA